MRLAIGTAQFGFDYGIANKHGRVPPSEVEKIIKFGRANGVDTLDTAIAYGDSERVLGEVGVADWKLITKLPPLPDECTDVSAWMRDQIRFSMERLGVKSLKGVLLHRAADLLGPKGAEIVAAFRDLKRDAIVGQTGFSIYEADSLEQLLQAYKPDLVQAPFNVIDRRLSESGWLQRLTNQGIEVHVRSVFMQGLLLMDENQRPTYFSRWQRLWADWSGYLNTSGTNSLSACLGFIMSYPSISHVVVGVDSASHLGQILEASRAGACDVPALLSCSEPALVNPGNWKMK